jgi:hypothetical protein
MLYLKALYKRSDFGRRLLEFAAYAMRSRGKVCSRKAPELSL